MGVVHPRMAAGASLVAAPRPEKRSVSTFWIAVALGYHEEVLGRMSKVGHQLLMVWEGRKSENVHVLGLFSAHFSH